VSILDNMGQFKLYREINGKLRLLVLLLIVYIAAYTNDYDDFDVY